MWEPDFSYLGKRSPEEMEAADTGKIPWWNREDAFGRNTHLRDLILSDTNSGSGGNGVREASSNVFVSSLPTCSSIPPTFGLPPTLKPEPRVAFAASNEVVCITNRTSEGQCDESQLPVAGPDPAWGPFEHAGLLREIGGLAGWKKVFVDKTHRLPPGW